ncbi:MAG: PucR family transcriptional regulator ligand-binding domain-containing protein [Lachnospiraceae bacterium]|nr:PucR family transcriptional regulator ligand-binding domain-containing protein [Lachnospiraceae bacterium]
MAFTAADFYRMFQNNLQILAGRGGLSRSVRDCGVLDYELIPSLKDRYFHSNFHESQMVLATFLYAKDEPYLITEAVKYLYQKKTAGLVIRNVFHLPIPPAALHYADARDFPVFLLNSPETSFDTLTYLVRLQSENLEREGYLRNKLDALLQRKQSEEEVRQAALELNPSLSDQYFCLFRGFDAAPLQLGEYAARYREEGLAGWRDFLCVFRQGILLVKSLEYSSRAEQEEVISAFFGRGFPGSSPLHGGVSEAHNTLQEFQQALREMLYASRYQDGSGLPYHRYRELGVYRLLFPYCQEEETRQFCRRILDPIAEYDAENKTSLTETLSVYVRANEDLAAAARQLAQHEQTIRYRLNRIYEISGLDKKSLADTEELSLAMKLELARQMLQ